MIVITGFVFFMIFGGIWTIIMKLDFIPYRDTTKIKSSRRISTILRSGRDVNIENKEGKTPLIQAIDNHSIDLVRKLLKAGAKTDYISTYNGMSLLSFATYYENLDIIKTLLDNVANINMKDKNGNTPLVEAVFNGNFEMVEFFSEQGGRYKYQG